MRKNNSEKNRYLPHPIDGIVSPSGKLPLREQSHEVVAVKSVLLLFLHQRPQGRLRRQWKPQELGIPTPLLRSIGLKPQGPHRLSESCTRFLLLLSRRDPALDGNEKGSQWRLGLEE